MCPGPSSWGYLIWRALVGSGRLGSGYLILLVDTRENPGGKNGVMTQPRMEPPRFEPRMELPWIGQPQFGFSRAKPFQPRIGQPEVGFRVEPPQRFGPIRDEPYREQVRFEQPYEFRNEPPRNEPYVPPQNKRNRPRNDYNGHNFLEEEVFDKGINFEERNRNIGVEPKRPYF